MEGRLSSFVLRLKMLDVSTFLDDEDATPFSPDSSNRARALEVFQGTGNVDALAKKYKLKTAFGTDVLFAAELARRQGAQLVKLTRWYTPSEVLTMATGANGEKLRRHHEERNALQEPVGKVRVIRCSRAVASDTGFGPVAPKSAQQDPEDPIDGPDVGVPSHDQVGELLAEGQVLEDEIASRAHGRAERRQEGYEEAEHRAWEEIQALGRIVNGSRANGVLANDRRLRPEARGEEGCDREQQGPHRERKPTKRGDPRRPGAPGGVTGLAGASAFRTEGCRARGGCRERASAAPAR